MFVPIIRLLSSRPRAVLLSTALALPMMLCSCGKPPPAATGKTGRTPAVVQMPRSTGTVSVVSVGDILLGSTAAPQLAAKGFDWPFEQVQPLLSRADIVVGNLAAPITSAAKKTSGEKDYSYKVSQASAPALKRAGFHAVSLGNNHVLDFGIPGMRDTIAALRTNNIEAFGAGASEDDARRGLVHDFGTLRIGWIGCGDDGTEPKALAKGKRGGFVLLSEKNLEEDIASMRKHADVVVVSVHWGKNYKGVTEAQQKLGRRAIELGADIVVGHHPHVAQGIEIYQGKPILYSVGNFVFGTKGRYEGKQAYGLVTRWLFEGKTLKWILATPIAVNNEMVKYQPQRVSASEAQEAFGPHLKRYNTPARWEGDTAFIGLGTQSGSAALPRLPWNEKGSNVLTTAQVGAPQ